MTTEDWVAAYREFQAIIDARVAELRRLEEQGCLSLGRDVVRGESAECLERGKGRIELIQQQLAEVDVIQARMAERRHKGPPGEVKP